MSKNSKGHPTFDHMPPELKKVISERAGNQQQSTSQTGNGKTAGDTKPKS